ncbi:MAG TPA: TonB-dependent receptor [Povalibacter sp.]|nr:TonB-dependent receptor [Povalibacter sp.]
MKHQPRSVASKSRALRSKALFTIVGGAALINPAFAQQAAPGDSLEEVVVTGLRGSLRASMDIKREAVGVVDAINAEDIGKFPDTNLSEALQRITGISIDRRNGEGALVTARGFGPQYNLVTLNGRAMPAADAFGNDEGASRSFNFANLSADAITGVEVFKTGRADITPGGIGATINIKTGKPFDNDGLVANVGAKALYDTSNRVGDDFTPELSGIFSYANDDKTWGVGLTGSYSKRDSGSIGANIFDWNVRKWDNDLEVVNTSTALSRDPNTDQINAVIRNAPQAGQLYAIPSDMRYNFTDTERTRTNGQLTVQFAPTDSLTLTADYTYAEQRIEQARGEQTTWMNANRFNLIEFDTGRSVATPLVLQEDEGTAKDFSYAQEYKDQTNKLKSAGFNAGWQVSDNFRLNFDIHDSEMSSRPSEPVSGAGQITVALGGRVLSTCDTVNEDLCTNRFNQTFHFNDGLPIAARTLFPQPTTTAPSSGGDPNYSFKASDMGSQVMQIFYQDQVTEITQARLDGELEFADTGGRLQFGVETRALEMRQRGSSGQMTLGDWGIAHPGEFPDGLLQPFSLIDQFNDFGTNGAPVAGWKGNAVGIGQWAAATYGHWQDPAQTDGVLMYNPAFNQNNRVEEDTNAVYFQIGLKSELGAMPVNLLLGVRYEDTDVTSTSYLIAPRGLIWQDNNDFSLAPGTTVQPFAADAQYDHILPSLDFDIDLTDTLKGRVSYSKTIARPQYNQMRSSISVGTPQGSTGQGNIAGATASNPALVPLSSDNIDLSLEWYFAESSYVSVGLFDKRVSNFIGNEVEPESVFGIRDQTSGPRAQAALTELRNRGFSTDDTNLFVMMALMEHADATGGAAAFNGTEAQHLAIAAQYEIEWRDDDPLYQFNVTRPVNNKEADIYGVEFAGQHFFGETGFGVQANYTIVRSNVAFDDAGDPSVNQFALLGLSDSANLILMYENFGVSARLAYNWRDSFLRNANRGNFRNPEYVEEYGQLDLSVDYSLNDQLTFSFEGINLTGEDLRVYGRSTLELWELTDQDPRYAIGARYRF